MVDGANYGGTMKMFVTNSSLRARWLVFIFGVFLLGGCGGESAQPNEDPNDLDISKNTPPPYHIYVTNERSGDLTVIAGGSHEVVATIPLGKRPRGIKVSPDGTRLFVALSGSPPA